MALATPPAPPPTAASPRLAARPARVLLLGLVLLVAVCGFVYELVIVAMGTYLIGNSILQVSLVLAAFVSSMGLGSLAAKPLLHAPVSAFVVVEAIVALVGGFSALILYAAFAYLDLYQPAMLAVAALIGLLVGCEIPLLMGLLQRVRRQEAGASVADLLAADYLGAVLAGVGFPLLLLPLLGQIDTALAIGALNLVAGAAVLWLLGEELTRRARAALIAGIVGVLGLLGAGALVAEEFELSARQALYDDPIVLAERTPYQEIVLTRSLTGGDLRLFLNGDLQFSSKDEYRYHEALVHPAMAGPRARVLVLGGGDGLAMREVLRYPDVEAVTEVELDPAMVKLARTDPRLTELNRGSLSDPRVDVVTEDAFRWLRSAPAGRFDVVIADFPDPNDAALAKLYSVEAYGLMRRALAPGGRLVVQSGSPYFARRAYWSVAASLQESGFAVSSYHVDVPSFGDWGFHLAGRTGDTGPDRSEDGRGPGRSGDGQGPGPGTAPGGGPGPPLRVEAPAPLRFLDPPTLTAAASFPPDRGRPEGELASTLTRPRILDFTREGYGDY